MRAKKFTCRADDPRMIATLKVQADEARAISPATFGAPPNDIAQRLAIRYRNRNDQNFIGVPYEVWAELADFYWKAYGEAGCPVPHPPQPQVAHHLVDKPDALPLHTDAEIAVLVKPGGGRVKTATVWLYPKL